MATPAVSAAPAAVATAPAVVPSSDASSNPVVATVLKSIVPLYSTTEKSEQDALIDSMYIPSAVFDNNLVRPPAEYHVVGNDSIKGLFHDSGKKNKAAKVTVQSSSIEPVTDATVQAVTPGAQKITLWLLQEYEGKKGPVSRQIETTLIVDGQGKVTDHYDVWQGEKETFALLKRVMGGATAMLSK